MSEEASRGNGRAIARRALLATAAVYVGFAGLGPLVGADLRFVALIGAFYFLPSWLLRGDPDRQQRYQVGPERVVPPWSWSAARVAAVLMLVVFPPFALLFWWFYAEVCGGSTWMLAPVLQLEALTPAAGNLERFLGGFCQRHSGDLWPAGLQLPPTWLELWGLGLVQVVVVELFAIALPEELFHRGYLMSALEEIWPPRRTILGAKLGLAAVVSSLLFALGHLVGMLELARLATFFPALLFAWLWKRSGSLWAPALFHAGSNLLMGILLASTFPP